MDSTVREAERQYHQDGDMIALARAVRQAGLVKDWTKGTQPCPHCGIVGTGIGAWPDDMQDFELMRDTIGLVYRCTMRDGCGQLFISTPWQTAYY